MEYIVFPTLRGGLGNRLFQIATSYAYSKKYNKKLVLSKRNEIDNPHSKINYFETIFRNIITMNEIKVKFNTIGEPSNKAISYFNLPNLVGNINLFGYFQCSKHFNDYKKELINLFVLPELKSNPKENSIFLHIRRGDYVQIKIHGGYDYNIYYRGALDLISKKYNNLNIYVFSNDIDWCKNWTLLKNYNQHQFHFIELNELETLKFMTLCDKGGICANSSFSWWGAYLNDFQNKTVIFPEQWFFEKPESDFPNEIAFEGCIKINTF